MQGPYHPKIIKYYGVFKFYYDNKSFRVDVRRPTHVPYRLLLTGIMLERMETNLYDHLYGYRQNSTIPDLNFVSEFFFQIGDALEFLHSV